MATRIASDTLINSQSLEAAVSGPDNANRLFVFTGGAPVNFSGGPSQPNRETYTFLIGPKLTRGQFVGAIAAASITKWAWQTIDAAPSDGAFNIELAEADWDDESQQVEVRVELRILTHGSAYGTIQQVSYHVTLV